MCRTTMSVVWSNERVLKLIELYLNYECLWDTGHRDYKNKLKKQDSWDSIAKILDVPLKEVESKIHTLRSQFTRERKKLKHSKKTGSGSEDVVNIKWFAYEALLFLIKGETTIGNKDTIQNYVEDNNSTQYETEDDFTQDQSEESRTNQTDTITQTGKKVAKKRSHDEKVDEAYEVMMNVKKRLEDREKMIDDFDIYGKYVASELRNIKDEYTTLIAKQYINNILIDARIGKYRQECNNTYGYTTGRRSSPGISSSNDGTTNQDSVQQNNEDAVDYDLRNILSQIKD